jgi:hypothetical protein
MPVVGMPASPATSAAVTTVGDSGRPPVDGLGDLTYSGSYHPSTGSESTVDWFFASPGERIDLFDRGPDAAVYLVAQAIVPQLPAKPVPTTPTPTPSPTPTPAPTTSPRCISGCGRRAAR